MKGKIQTIENNLLTHTKELESQIEKTNTGLITPIKNQN